MGEMDSTDFSLYKDQLYRSAEPVEDTDTSSIHSIENFPVQVTDPHDAVTLQLSSVSPNACRIQQPVEDVDCTCSSSSSPEPKALLTLCSCCSPPPPHIGDVLNDPELLDALRLKLDPARFTVKNWRHVGARWGLSFDELTLLEQRAESPTLELLVRFRHKPVQELHALCLFYQRIDVTRILTHWTQGDWPRRWRLRHLRQ
ncbi:unnamed protein product [Knipowitschia caucasica]|uniref:Ectodysplasin-A receptor-associated adapter protein n=1 Tax=Knipowitschia caucasica TaxID=637954 RepID=A0AAV2JT97_KNICA